MADVKISGLPASTVPLAGTEVLPIVQGGTTKQVSIANVTAGRSVAASSVITPTIQAEAGSAGGTIKNGSGVAQMQWGSGGASNLSLEVATNINPANAAVSIAPTGTGTVTINPATASTMNNVAIGGTTPLAGSFTTVKASTTMSVGAATPSASGAGITFPATQSASTDANTLDDYEEGTWTGTFNIGGTSNATSTGRYTKVGRIVTYDINFFASGYTESGTGSLTITGMPFTSQTNSISMGQIGYFEGYSATTNGFAYTQISSASTTLSFVRGAAGNFQDITDTLFSTSTLLIRISGTYTTA